MKQAIGWLPVIGVGSFVFLAFYFGWIEAAGAVIDRAVDQFCSFWRGSFGAESEFGFTFIVTSLLGVLLVSLICGLVSSFIVTNRMAFFSDALAHCAFAGVALGILSRVVTVGGGVSLDDDQVLGFMVFFGVVFGLAIAYVKEQTSMSSDTVIGVFFAGAMGLGAILLKHVQGAGFVENFLFGDLLGISGRDLVLLCLLLVATAGFLVWHYNQLVFMSFNPSLARSRNFSVRMGNYLFIVLLGLIVNICLKVAGALLINALLILPSAIAINLSRDLRRFFWYSAFISLGTGLGGWAASAFWHPRLGNKPISFSSGGSIVVIGVFLFALSMPLGRWLRGSRAPSRASI